jgi:hypothetical protein
VGVHLVPEESRHTSGQGRREINLVLYFLSVVDGYGSKWLDASIETL